MEMYITSGYRRYSLNLYTPLELEEGLQQVGQLIDLGGLELIDDARLSTLVRGGLVGAACPDGDHQFDIIRHASSYTSRLHICKLNGGAMVMSPTNPDFELRGRPLIESVVEGWNLGKGSAIGLFSHFPCGRAKVTERSLKQVICDTLHAELHLIEVLNLPAEFVLSFMHVDWTPFEINLQKKERRTYIIRSCCAAKFDQTLSTK